MFTFIDIALTRCCNFSCDYCIAKATHAQYQPHPLPSAYELKPKDMTYEHGPGTRVYALNSETIKPHFLLRFITSNFQPSECVIQFGGGEPMLHDSFYDLLMILLCHNYKVIVNSNIDLIKYMPKNLIKDIPHKNVYFRPSWHPEQRNFEGFCQDLHDLPDVPTMVNYVAHPKRVENGLFEEHVKLLQELVNPITDKFIRPGIGYEVTHFEGDYCNKHYDKMTDYFKDKVANSEYPDNIIPTHPEGINYVSVAANGIIRRCHKLNIGDIYTGHFERNPNNLMKCIYKEGIDNAGCSLWRSWQSLAKLEEKTTVKYNMEMVNEKDTAIA